MYDLIAIGNPVYDEIITPQARFGERILSGCSTNACLAAKRLGLGRVGLIGCIGPDFESAFRRDMVSYGVEVVKAKPSKRTGGFRLIYDSKGNRTLDVLGVAGKIRPEDVPEEAFESRTILIAPILQEVDISLIKFLRNVTDAEIFLDPQGMIREVGGDGRIREIIDSRRAKNLSTLVDIIKPNEHEARALTGAENPFTATRILNEWGAKISIVTLAERGSIIGKGGNYLKIPPYTTVSVDPTGAGDTYIGAFITKFLEGRQLFECAIFASVAASIKVEHRGPDFPINQTEALRRMNQLLRGNNNHSP